MQDFLHNKPKYQQVYDELISTLTTKGYKVGDRLPSEREFAAMLNVNVLTVRRAFRELIAADFVSKRVGSGTYLNREISDNWDDHAVNLLIASSSNGTAQKIFENCGKNAVAAFGREYRIVYTSQYNIRDIIRSSLLYRQPTVFCGSIPSYKDFESDIAGSRELFVSVGAKDNPGLLAAVISDDGVGVGSLMEHLQKRGHRRIAFMSSCRREANGNSVLDIQYRKWKSLIKDDYSPELFLGIDSAKYDLDQMEAGYNELKKLQGASDFTALLCSTDDYMYGAMAALRESGKSVPADVSVVSIGNTDLSRFHSPGITSADLNFPELFSEALRLLYHNISHPGQIEMLRTVKPFLVPRQSVAAVLT